MIPQGELEDVVGERDVWATLLSFLPNGLHLEEIIMA